MKFSNTEIENLAKVLKENKLGSIAYEQEGCKITLSSSSTGVAETSSLPAQANALSPEEPALDSFKTEVIKCPLIGHFYLTQTPDSDPYVTVGSTIEAGDVVGILQAMKVSNEIKSEISGEIVEICAENGQFVDFDSPLFKVRV